MDSKILLGRIIQKMIDQGYCQVETYNRFEYLSHSDNQLIVGRENGQDTPIYFKQLIHAIEQYQLSPSDYELGPSKTRDYGIKYTNSPIWSLLHLLDKQDYK